MQQPPQMPPIQQPYVTPVQQPQTPRPAGGRMAFLQFGLIFGGSIGLIDVLYSYFLSVTNLPFLDSLAQALFRLPIFLYNAVYTFILSIPIYVLLFICFLLAGLFAARKAKRVASGTFAGLLVGGVYLVVDLLIANLLLLYLVTFPRLAFQLSPTEFANFQGAVLSSALTYSLVAGLLLIGVGALVGSLGGLIGRGSTSTPTPQYMTFMPNPSFPQPGQPGYPNQPGYPQPPVFPGQPGQAEQPKQPPSLPGSGQ